MRYVNPAHYDTEDDYWRAVERELRSEEARAERDIEEALDASRDD